MHLRKLSKIHLSLKGRIKSCQATRAILFEYALFHANIIGAKRSHEYGSKFGGSRTICRPPNRRVRLEYSVGNENVGNMEKGLLRKAVEGLLPEEVLYRKRIHTQKPTTQITRMV